MSDTAKSCLLAAATMAVLWFFWIGFPSLMGKFYGNRELMVRTAVLLSNPNLTDPRPMSLDERQHCTVEPDYHMLYQLDYEAQRRLGRGLEFPLYDPYRMLGVPLWGSLVTEPLNPLFFLLQNLPHGWHVALKSLIYFMLAAAGTAWLCWRLGVKSVLGAAVSGCFYASSTYMFFFIHWQNGMGIASLAPSALASLHAWLETARKKYLVLWFLALAWMISMNMVQIFSHFCLLTAAFSLSWMLASRQFFQVKAWRRLIAAGLASLFAAITLGGFLWEVLAYSSLSSRPAFDFHPEIYPYIRLPDFRQAFSDLLLAVPSPMTSESWWRPVILLPFAMMAALGAWNLAERREGPDSESRLIFYLLVFYVLFFFFGWFDRILYAIGGKVYGPNPIAIRGMFSLYLCLSLAAGIGWKIFCEKIEKPKLWVLALLTVFSLAYMSASLGTGEFGLWATGPHNGLFFSSQRWMPSFHLMAISSLILAFCLAGRAHLPFQVSQKSLEKGFFVLSALAFLGLGFVRIPQNTGDSAAFLWQETNPTNFQRQTRILPPIPYHAMGGPLGDLRFLHDAVLAHFGIIGFSGYHTTFSRQERRLYDIFLTEDFKKWRVKPGTWWKDTGWGFYQTFLEAKSLELGGAMEPIQIFRLELCGVTSLLPFPHCAEAHDWNKPYLWRRENTRARSAAHLFRNKKPQEVAKVFEESMDKEHHQELQAAAIPLKISFDSSRQTYELFLSGDQGTVLFAMNLRRNYRCLIDGKPVKKEPDPLLPFWMVEVPEASQRLLFVPDFLSIWLRLLFFAGTGLLLFAVLVVFAPKISGGGL